MGEESWRGKVVCERGVSGGACVACIECLYDGGICVV